MKSLIAQALVTAAGPGLTVRFEPADEVVRADPGAPLQPQLIKDQRPPLNPRFTFESYMEAPFNRLAVTAALDVADNPDTRYSPLFISGNSGMGKTHLLHAIAQRAHTSGLRLLLVTAEQFLSEFTTAVKNRQGAAFRARFQEPDLLLMDDVHQLVGKKATLKAFYQLIADLHDKGRAVVVAGDPSAMAGEATRFRTMLRWGLVAHIGEPTAADRVSFIDLKAAAQGMALPAEVQQYIALRVRSSIRDLEGAVNRVSALARISLDALTIDFTAKALQPASITPEEERSVTPSQLIEAVARHLELPPSEITGPRRVRNLTYARHVAMYLLRHDGAMTFAAIAQLMNKRDHSTVVHACSHLVYELNVSPELRADIDAIRASLHMPVSAA